MDWLKRMMYGRYGVDQLSYGLLVGCMLCVVFARITNWSIFGFINMLLFALCFFRILSRNVTSRRRENEQFLAKWNPIKDKLAGKFNTAGSDATHRFYRCPGCKSKLRVPRGRGKITITCPYCHAEFIKKT